MSASGSPSAPLRGVLYLNGAAEHVLIDDELIVYSPAKQGYFGIQGAAAEVFKVLRDTMGGLSEPRIIAAIAIEHTVDETGLEMIREGIQTLIELGVSYET